jgi:MFS family permease
MLIQQLSCVNNVIFYSSTIFKAAGSHLSESYQSIFVGVAQLLAAFVSTYFVEKLGRRVLLQASNLLVIASLALLGLFFYWDAEGGKSATAGYEWLPLVSCVVFIVGFSFGLGPVPWLMMGELFPVRFRGPASGIASCVNWASAFLTTKSFPASMALFGLHGTFWFYAVATFVGAVFVHKCVPETRGKSLNQISAYFVRATHVA